MERAAAPLTKALWPLLPATAFIALAAHHPARSPTLHTKSHPACQIPPEFKRVYEREIHGVILRGRGAVMNGVSILGATICQAGTLSLTGNGQIALGEAPLLEVALDSVVLARLPFKETKTVTLNVPKAGWLTLAYLNDFYQADVRIAVLENIKLRGSCSAIHGELPANTGGQWLPAEATAYVVGFPGLTLQPCAAGQITTLLSGRAGGGAFPEVEFLQHGQVVKSVQTSATQQLVRLDVNGEPLHVRVKSPYARLIGDRNLVLTDINFTPQGQP